MSQLLCRSERPRSSSEAFSFAHTLHMRTTSKRWRLAAIIAISALFLSVVILAAVLGYFINISTARESEPNNKPEPVPPDADNDTIPGCFPAGSIVRTRAGWIAIEDLQIGDEVLDVTSHGQLVYSKVYAWLRRDNLNHRFIRLTTENGEQSFLTPNHLVFRAVGINACMLCSGSHDVVLASHIKVGDIIFLLDKIEMACHYSTVVAVELLTAKGAYAPATMSGSLIVDNTLVSCYTSYWFFDLVGHYFIDRVIFAPLKMFYIVITNIFQAEMSAVMLELLMQTKDGALWYVDFWKVFRSAIA